MPSLLVHLALAGLIAAGLLGPAFSERHLAVVFAVVVVADLDVFVGLVVPGAHRAALHTLLLPLVGGGLLAYDTRVRDVSLFLDRFGPASLRVAWVSLLAFVFAAVGLDLFTTGANPLYPLHDQFYRINGRAILTNKQGFLQTFLEIDHGTVEATQLGSTEEVHVSSGVDPERGATPATARRVFPVAGSGWELLLLLTSVVVVGGWLHQDNIPMSSTGNTE